jgi:hypothetical protein
MKIDFQVLGRRLTATDIPESVGRWLDSFWNFPEHSAPSNPYSITISVIPQPPDLESTTWVRQPVRLPDRLLHLLRRGAQWIGDAGNNGVESWTESQRMRINIWGKEWHREDPYHYLFLALTEALRNSGLLPLHAAVASHDGRISAFLGQSGAGKSTTLLRLTQTGWTGLAEDLSWLDPVTMRVFGWDRGVRLWPAAAGHFFNQIRVPGRDGKTTIPYSELAMGEQRSGTLRRIALLVRDQSLAPRWEPADHHQAIKALWEATGLPLSAESRSEVSRGIEKVVKSVDFVQLRLGEIGAPIPPPPTV